MASPQDKSDKPAKENDSTSAEKDSLDLDNFFMEGTKSPGSTPPRPLVNLPHSSPSRSAHSNPSDELVPGHWMDRAETSKQKRAHGQHEQPMLVPRESTSLDSVGCAAVLRCRYVGLDRDHSITCCSNAVLQMLYAWVTFREHLLTHHSYGRFHRALSSLFAEMEEEACRNDANSTTAAVVSSADFDATFRNVHIAISHREDAHQYLSTLLKALHNEVNRVVKPDESGEQLATSQQAWDYHCSHEDNSFYSRQMMGQFETVFTCQGCKQQSVAWCTKWQLQVQLPENHNLEEKPLSLANLINESLGDQLLQDPSAPICAQCKACHPTIKRQRLNRAPRYLLIQLERFATNRTEYECQVKPDLQLGLPCVSSQAGHYQLMSCVMHCGGSVKGYYSTYHHDQGTNRWVHFYDRLVASVKEAEVFENMTKFGYLFLYKQQIEPSTN